VVAGAELFCNWKPNKSLSFEGTRKASFRYQATKIKAEEDKHACWLRQAASHQKGAIQKDATVKKDEYQRG